MNFEPHAGLPPDWLSAVCGGFPYVYIRTVSVDFHTRREADDAAARAFAALPADRQRELLTPAETPA